MHGNNRESGWEVGVASPGKAFWIFLFYSPQVGLKENHFAVFSPLDPKEEILNVRFLR